MQADDGERLQIFEDEIAIAGGVDGVSRGCGETKLAGGNGAVERKRCSGHCA